MILLFFKTLYICYEDPFRGTKNTYQHYPLSDEIAQKHFFFLIPSNIIYIILARCRTYAKLRYGF